MALFFGWMWTFLMTFILSDMRCAISFNLDRLMRILIIRSNSYQLMNELLRRKMHSCVHRICLYGFVLFCVCACWSMHGHVASNQNNYFACVGIVFANRTRNRAKKYISKIKDLLSQYKCEIERNHTTHVR